MPDIALSLVRVSKRYGARTIFEDLTFGLMMGEKVGLIGRNGAGKSTLFKLLSGDEQSDGGEVILTQGLRIARLSQEPDFHEGASIREALIEAMADHRDLLLRHEELHHRMAEGTLDDKAHQELDAVDHKLNDWGWDLEPRLKQAQTEWQLGDLERPVAGLSGGWRKRVALAQAWLKAPDLLVLDEPTNHLDAEQVEKLQAWLQNFPGALLLITHDRHLLDAVVDRMLELDNGRVASYDGGYSDYLLLKADQEFREQRLTEHMQNRLRTELAWLRRGAKARTRKSKLRIEEVLDLKDTVEDRTRVTARMSLAFQGGQNRSDAMLSGEGVRFAYPGGPELMGGLDFAVQRGMRVALLGPNGCGKSTLLNLLLGGLEATSGTLVRHPKIQITTISQGRGELEGARSVSDNLADRAGVVKLPNGATQPVVVYLSRFGFSAEDQRRDAASLSGGERNRLLLAKAMLQPADLLVLDEPTNDLDIPTLQNLEEALQGFPGALLLVSHDRFFLDQVATHTLAWNPNGDPRWELYEGPPDTVRSLRAQRAATAAPKAEAPKPAAKTEAPKAKKPGLSQKEQRRFVEVEQAMEQLQVRIAHLDTLLADPAAFLTADAPGHQALKDREAAKSDLEGLEMEWLELEEKKAL